MWDILTHFARYRDWNHSPVDRRRERAEGETLRVHIKPPDGKGMTFRVTVLRAVPQCELRWLGRLMLPRLFNDEQSFAHRPLDNGRRKTTH